MSRLAVGTPVWVYERSLYPVEATISKVIDLSFESDGDSVLGYEVSQSDSTALNGRCVGQHNIYLRPQQRGDLLKELRDDIEFLDSYVRSLEDEREEEEA